MKIIAWTKKIYGDSTVSQSELWDYLHFSKDLPAGKRIIQTEDGPGEIDVVAPNVDEDKFAPLNVCPAGSIASGEACITDVETKPLYDPPHEKDLLRLSSGCYGEDTMCPRGWIVGEKTKKITIKTPHKWFKSQGIVADAVDENIEYMEDRTLKTGPILDVEKEKVCFKKGGQPLEMEHIRLITDSIIGYGGYSEFPWWDLDWDAMIHIADVRYKQGADLIEKEGFAVCKHEYNDYYCLVFGDKQDAEYAKKELDYYDYSTEFKKDTRDSLEEEFIDGKIEKIYPRGQKKLNEYTILSDTARERQNLFKRLKERYKDEMEQEITEERIDDKMNFERELFWDDIDGRYDTYLGLCSDHVGKCGMNRDDLDILFIVQKHEKGKTRNKVVVINEI